MLAEEHGLIGGLVLLTLYLLLIAYGYAIALRARSMYGLLVAGGVTILMFFYVFIHVALLSRLVLVVGVPLRLVSYGCSALLTLLVGWVWLMCVFVHPAFQIPHKLL